MSIDETLLIDCSSLEQSLAFAEQLGARLKGGEVIELVSDIGGGKTTFVRGLAKGMGSTDTTSSPTFTISNVYQSSKLTMHHFDFYRLHEPGIMREELAEVIADPQAVVVVEWANIVDDVLPNSRLTVRITATGEESRRYEVLAPDNVEYLVKEII